MSESMRILVHDYGGDAFPVQLSRALAGRGDHVLHLYAGHNTTPRGDLVSHASDPPGFTVEGLSIRKPLRKDAFVRRWLQEREYEHLLAARIRAFLPQVVLSANTPLDAQRSALVVSQQLGARFVFWLQDLLGVAARSILRSRLPVMGSLVGSYYINLEKRLLRRSDGVVTITEDFLPKLRNWVIDDAKIKVIPNWAPLEAISPQPKSNAWSQEHGLDEKFCLLYAGSLGMKHNPDMLLQLAAHFRHDPVVCVVVVSEGQGAKWLKRRNDDLGLKNLLLFDFQPFERLPEVLGLGDLLVALLEPNASVFSVPSKVLAYLCAQRPLLLAVPEDNQAARIVRDHRAGMVVPPDDVDAFMHAAEKFIIDPSLCREFAVNARKYAEAHFDIQKIADEFLEVLFP